MLIKKILNQKLVFFREIDKDGRKERRKMEEKE